MDAREEVQEEYRKSLERMRRVFPEAAAGFPEPEALSSFRVIPRVIPTPSVQPGAVPGPAAVVTPAPPADARTFGPPPRGRPTRARGLGRVYPRGQVWWVQYCFRGKAYRETSGSAIRADAVKLLRRRLEEMGRGRLVGPDVERTTFKDLERFLLDDYRVNGRKAVAWATTTLAALRDFFGETGLARDITADRINAYIASGLDAGYKPATLRNHLAVLRRALRLAERAGKAICPPFPTISVSNARKGFFEAEQFQAVAAHLPGHLRPLATFMYLTGWRKGEALGLTWDRVDFAAAVVRLEPGTTKNDEGRTFPFSALPDLEALLRKQRLDTIALERRAGQAIPWVFHRNGKPIRDFRGAWKEACKKAGCPDRIPHDFRRTAVRNLERAGVPRSVAMKLTGHKTEAVYRRYAIVSEADLSAGVAKLAALRPLDVKRQDEGIDTVLAQFGASGDSDGER